MFQLITTRIPLVFAQGVQESQHVEVVPFLHTFRFLPTLWHWFFFLPRMGVLEWFDVFTRPNTCNWKKSGKFNVKETTMTTVFQLFEEDGFILRKFPHTQASYCRHICWQGSAAERNCLANLTRSETLININRQRKSFPKSMSVLEQKSPFPVIPKNIYLENCSSETGSFSSSNEARH